MTAPVPLPPEITELLKPTPLGPLLNRPVNDVLAEMGLPNLPELPPMPPMPGLPPMPVIDLAAMAKPLTELASGMGTGNIAAGPDPTEVLSQVSSVLQSVMGMAGPGLQALGALWQSAGATAALTKGAQAQADGAALAEQGTATAGVMAQGLTTVGTGSALLSGIIAKFLTTVVATGPFLVTPPGQAVLLAASIESLTEASAVVAKTRAELTVESAEMTATGTKIPVTNAPSTGGGMNPLSLASQLLGGLGSPMASMASHGLSAATKVAKPHVPTPVAKPVARSTGGGGLRAGGPVTQPRQLQAFGGTHNANATHNATTTPGGSTIRTSGVTGSPMMPMSGAPGTAGAAARAVSHTAIDATHMSVDAPFADEVVGELGATTAPVVGEADFRATPPLSQNLAL